VSADTHGTVMMRRSLQDGAARATVRAEPVAGVAA